VAGSENSVALELVPQQKGAYASTENGQGAPEVPPPVSRPVRTDGRVTNVVRFEEEVVGFLLETAKVLGIPKSVAVIYGLCFASPEPLSFADLNKRLKISQGSISQGLKVLREFGALRVVQLACLGARPSGFEETQRRSARSRGFYTPALELREFAVRWIKQRWEHPLPAGDSRLRAIIKALSPGRSGSRELMARLGYPQSWRQQSQALVPMIEAFLG
jgi:HTH-type transcriptional regulator, glycine betaine synthesis regulator